MYDEQDFMPLLLSFRDSSSIMPLRTFTITWTKVNHMMQQINAQGIEN
jgi:hypothetical protein